MSYILDLLKQRSNTTCELSGATDDLVVYNVAPDKMDSPENCILISKTCVSQINNPESTDANFWRCLNDSMWNENLPVQIVAWRMLSRLKNEGWANDLLEMMYLDDDALQWAKATGEG